MILFLVVTFHFTIIAVTPTQLHTNLVFLIPIHQKPNRPHILLNAMGKLTVTHCSKQL